MPQKYRTDGGNYRLNKAPTNPQRGKELAKSSKQILASTEDIWTAQFQRMGKTYTPPKLVLYTGSIQQDAAMEMPRLGLSTARLINASIWISLFLATMKQQLGAGGDFANAYVIAHEVGHHVQYLLGTLDAAHQQMAQESEKESNRTSVRIELPSRLLCWCLGLSRRGTIQIAGGRRHRRSDKYSWRNWRRLPLQNKAQGYTVPGCLQPWHPQNNV